MIEIANLPTGVAMALLFGARIYDYENIGLLQLRFDLLLEREAWLQEPLVEIHLGEEIP